MSAETLLGATGSLEPLVALRGLLADDVFFVRAHAVRAVGEGHPRFTELFQAVRWGHLRLLTDHMLPEVVRSGLAEFCDVFCERGVFGLDESERILRPFKK